MNHIKLLFVFFFVNTFLYSQEVKEKWVSSVYVDLNSTYESRYTYGTSVYYPSYSGSIELAYNLDYKIFKRLSFGGLVSLNRFLTPKISSLKIGGAIKYYYVQDKYHFITIHMASHFPLNSERFKRGHQLRLGQFFDLSNLLGKRLLLGLYYNLDKLNLENSSPLLDGLSKNVSYSTLLTDSWGVSLGLKF